MNDVQVMSVKTGTVLIEDIHIDVPEGCVVSIPEETALRSKDLWRLIAQRLLFRYHGGPIHTAAPPVSIPAIVKEHAMAEAVPAPFVAAPMAAAGPHPLEEQNRLLRQALEDRDALAAALQAQTGQISELLGVVRDLAARSTTPMPMATSQGNGAKPFVKTPEVSGAAPMFIPSTIKTDLDGHVEIQKDAQEGGVSEASSALRRLREKKGDSR